MDSVKPQKINQEEQIHQTQALTTAPISLGAKVNSLTEHEVETKPLELESGSLKSVDSKKHAWFTKFKFASLASVLFFSPVSALNILGKSSEYKIRSQRWVQIGLSKKNYSCFTPCTLKLTENQVQSLYWKSASKAGQTRIYTHPKNKVINLDL